MPASTPLLDKMLARRKASIMRRKARAASHGLGRPPKGNRRAWAALDRDHGKKHAGKCGKCAKPLKTANDELNSMGAAACYATKHN